MTSDVESDIQTIKHIPHAFGRAILVVFVELGCTQHGLCKNGSKAERLDVDGHLQEHPRHRPHNQREQEQKLYVATEVGPLPEVTAIKIYKTTSM